MFEVLHQRKGRVTDLRARVLPERSAFNAALDQFSERDENGSKRPVARRSAETCARVVDGIEQALAELAQIQASEDLSTADAAALRELTTSLERSGAELETVMLHMLKRVKG